MSLLADHQRWLAGCRHVSNRGSVLTPGDIVHGGYGDYVETMRCPNGLPVDRRTPDQCPAWVARIERARRDSEALSQKVRVREAARGLSADDVSQFIQEIRAWVNSRTWQAVGSTESSQAGKG